MQPKPNIVHLPVYQPGKPIEEVQRELGLQEVTKLASNENPFGASPQVNEVMIRELSNMSLYPDGGAAELTAAVASMWNVGMNQIIFGAGSDDVILMIARAYLVPGDETVISTHTFSQYKHNAEVENAVIREVPLREATYDLEAMRQQITPRTKIVWICNPNNPTGTVVSHQQLADFLDAVPDSVLVVLDEAYAEYIDDADYPDSLELLQQHPNVVILRTFSKIYGLASLRIGYGIGHPDVIHTINQVREPFNTTRFAQVAALAALRDQEFVANCRRWNQEGLQYLKQQFERLGLSYFPAYGNFIMVDVNRPAEPVFDGLMRRGYIVRGGHKLDFPTMIRVTVGSRKQNEGFIAALEQVLADVAVLT